MRLGAIFPTTEIGDDPAQIRAFAQAVEAMGYDHILAFDHVLGADPDRPGGWRGPYTIDTPFHEPFVLFGYLAALTTRVELVTGVIILPQRQTALVAKQAAELDVLSGGRLRLGVGLGWNAVEYEALGESFANRGRRIEEQAEVMRLLWTQKRVDFKGRWHTIDAAGLNPMPVQRPIPLWFGGFAEKAIERIARIGDGWFPLQPLGDEMRAAIERLRDYAAKAGRPPDAVGIEGRVAVGQGGPDDWAATARQWRELGATHFTVHTMNAGYTSLDQHLDALRRFKELVM